MKNYNYILLTLVISVLTSGGVAALIVQYSLPNPGTLTRDDVVEIISGSNYVTSDEVTSQINASGAILSKELSNTKALIVEQKTRIDLIEEKQVDLSTTFAEQISESAHSADPPAIKKPTASIPERANEKGPQDIRIPRSGKQVDFRLTSSDQVIYGVMIKGDVIFKSTSSIYTGNSIMHRLRGKTVLSVFIYNGSDDVLEINSLSLDATIRLPGKTKKSLSSLFSDPLGQGSKTIVPSTSEVVWLYFEGEFCISDIQDIWLGGLSFIFDDGKMSRVD